MYAIIQTGGKQYRVFEGDRIAVEKLAVEPGSTVDLDVLFLADCSKMVIDADALAEASVQAEVLEHFKGEKALVFKFKKRKGYKRLRGHRQELTRLKIIDISMTGKTSSGQEPSAAKAGKTDDAEELQADQVDVALADSADEAAVDGQVDEAAAVQVDEAADDVADEAADQAEEAAEAAGEADEAAGEADEAVEAVEATDEAPAGQDDEDKN